MSHNVYTKPYKCTLHRAKIATLQPKTDKPCIFVYWLVAKCPGLNAVDIEGWLFILFLISPFAALLYVFKDYKYPLENDNCLANINDKQSM